MIDDSERFRAWADNNGVSLEPAFEHRIRTTPAGDDQDAFLPLPVVCLAVRVDGDLVTVAPHTTGTTADTATDTLSDVASLLDHDGRPRRWTTCPRTTRSVLRSKMEASGPEQSPTNDHGAVRRPRGCRGEMPPRHRRAQSSIRA